MTPTRPAAHSARHHRGAAAGKITLRTALVAAAGALLAAAVMGLVSSTHASASGRTYTWVGGTGSNWSTPANWSCTGTGCAGVTQDPVDDPNSDVVLPAGAPLSTTLDQSATLNSLTVLDNYSIAGTGTQINSAGLSVPSPSALTLAGGTPSGVTLQAPMTSAVNDVIVDDGNTLATHDACGALVCLSAVTLGGTGPASTSHPGALVLTGNVEQVALTVSDSTTIGTAGHTVNFKSVNDAAATLTATGGGVVEMDTTLALSHLDLAMGPGATLTYNGSLHNVSLADGATLGDKTFPETITVSGTLTVAGTAHIVLVDDNVGHVASQLTLSNTPVIPNGATLSIDGGFGGVVTLDSSSLTTGTIAVGSGATLHTSGTLGALSVAGTGDPNASPADAVHLDGDLTANSLTAPSDGGIDLGGHQLTASALVDPVAPSKVILDGTGIFLVGSGTPTSAPHLSLAESSFNADIQAAGDLEMGSVTLPADGIFYNPFDTVTLAGSLILTGDGAQMNGIGGTVAVQQGLTDNGHTLFVDGSGGTTLDLQGTNTSPTGLVDVLPGNELKSASALHTVQLDGGSFDATASLTVAGLTTYADSTASADAAKTLTVTTLGDQSQTLTIGGPGTVKVGAPNLSNLNIVVSGGTLETAASSGSSNQLFTVTLDGGTTLANAGPADLHVSGALTSSGSTIISGTGTNVVTDGGISAPAATTITLSGGANGVTLQAGTLGTTNASFAVSAGSDLNASGTIGGLTLAGSGPGGTAQALSLSDNLAVDGPSTLGADATAQVPSGDTLTLADPLNPASERTLSLTGTGVTVIDGGSAANLDVSVGGLANLAAQGVIGSVTLGNGSSLTDLGGNLLTLDGKLHTTGAAATLSAGGIGSTILVQPSNGWDDQNSTTLTILGDSGTPSLNMTLILSGVSDSTGRIVVQGGGGGPAGSTLQATGSLRQVDVSGDGVGGTAGVIDVPSGTLTAGKLDVVTDSKVVAAPGATLVASTTNDPAKTLSVGGGGTLSLTDPNLGNLALAPISSVLRTTGSTQAQLATVDLGTGSTLDDESTSIVLAVGALSLQNSAAVEGAGTTAGVTSLALNNHTLTLKTAPGSASGGVTVMADNLALGVNDNIVVDSGNRLIGTGSIPNLEISGFGPSGNGAALAVDNVNAPGTLNVGTLTLDANSAILTDPGRNLNVSTLVNPGPSNLDLLGPGALSGPSNVTLPTSTYGVLEVNGGVVVKGGTITAVETILHGDSALEPQSVTLAGAPAVVVPDSSVVTPAQLGSSVVGTTLTGPGGGTLATSVNPGGWLLVPASIVDNGSPVALTVDPAGQATVELTAPSNSYSGTTTVLSGATLIVDSQQPKSDVSLDGGTLAGNGTVGRISGSTVNGGTVVPDLGSTLTAAGHVNLSNSSGGVDTFVAHLGGTPAELAAPNGATLSNGAFAAQLTVLSGGYTPAVGQTFTILHSATPTGGFLNQPDGSELFSSDQSPKRFRINYSSGDVVLTYLGPVGTTVGVAPDTNPQGYGQPVTFTATTTSSDLQVADPITGTVQFLDGSTPLGSPVTVSGGQAQLVTSSLLPGDHSITGQYSGDNVYSGATSPAVVEHVNALPTTTTLTSSPLNTAGHNSVPSGNPVTFLATVAGPSSPGGTVTFYDGLTTLGSAPVSGGQAQLVTATLPIGLHEVTAQYNGDTTHAGSASTVLDQHISAPTTTTVGVPQTTVPAGSVVTATVHVASATAGTISGTVTCTDDAVPLAGPVALDPAGNAQCATPPLTAGKHTLSAVYGGDDSYTPSASPNLNVYTLAQSVVLSTTSPPSPDGNPMDFASPAGTALTFSSLVSGNSGPPTGTVTFFDGGSSIGSGPLAPQTGNLALATLTTTLSPGLHVVTAQYGGDGNNGVGSSNTVNQFVTLPTSTALSISSNPVVQNNVPSLSFVAHVSTASPPIPVPGGTVTFVDQGNSTTLGTAPLLTDGSATLTGVSGSKTIFGAQNIVATYNGDNEWTPSTSSPRSETVLIPTTTTVASSRNPINAHRSMSFTVTVSSGSGVPTGGVTLLDGGSALGTAPVDGAGHAVFSVGPLSGGNHAITAVFTGTGLFGPSSGGLTQTVVPPNQGYWLVASDGGIFPFGSAQGYGSTGGMHLNQPIVGMAATPDGRGYWLVASDGGIFPFGDAGGFGSTGGIHLNRPIVGMAPTPDGGGYWLVASDGGIFPFGDAVGYGSAGSVRLNQPIVGMAPTPSGRGYWLVASDGGIFPFGDATGYGSTGGIHLNQSIVGMAPTPDGGGYWLVASDGGIFPFGDAQGFGSTGAMHLNQPIVGMQPSPDGGGYWLVASDGGIFPFGDAVGLGSTGGIHLNQPVVGMGAPLNGFAQLPG